MLTLESMIAIGGALHFLLLVASSLVPRVLKWRESLATLDLFLRRVIWVHGFFLVLVIIGFGTLSLLYPATLVSGTPLARSVSGFIALFWLARLGVQLFVFDARPVIHHWVLKLGYHGLTAVFTYLAVVYGLAAVCPHMLSSPYAS